RRRRARPRGDAERGGERDNGGSRGCAQGAAARHRRCGGRRLHSEGRLMTELRFARAINQALADAMAADESVILVGDDIAAAGGPFGVTRGLLDSFGPERVRDTPISEATIVNAAVGAALSGLRPIVEIMFMDFVALAMDGVVNQAAKVRFMFGGQT